MRRCHNGQPVANIFKLANIPRKAEATELFQGSIRNPFGLDAKLLGTLLQKVPRQCKHVLAAFTQGGQAQANHIEAMVQIFAEHAVLDALLQVLMGRSNHAQVGLDRIVAAHAVKMTVAQYAQQAGLQVRRHVANFIKKQRSALGLFKAAPAHGLRASKCTAFVAEQLALQQIFGDGCSVDGNKRPVGTV